MNRATSRVLSCIVMILTPSLASAAQEPPRTLHTIDARTPQGLRQLFAYDGDPLPLLSAHRGGAGEGWPENCIATFEQTLRHGWSMLEIDLRYSKDGVLVLHHDPTLERTTNGAGRVSDHTLAELKRLRLKDRAGQVTDERIPTLDEAFEWARGKTILILDIKDIPIEDAVRRIAAHHAEAHAMVMAYSFADIKQCHALNANIMMEVMIGNSERFEGFEKTSVPWSHIIAFVGHTPPTETDLCPRIHAKGARTMAGTSRNIDRRFLDRVVTDMASLEPDYRALLTMGVDVIETDIPRQLAPLLYESRPIPASKAAYFTRPAPPPPAN